MQTLTALDIQEEPYALEEVVYISWQLNSSEHCLTHEMHIVLPTNLQNLLRISSTLILLLRIGNCFFFSIN